MNQPQTALDEVEDDLPSVFAKNVSLIFVVVATSTIDRGLFQGLAKYTDLFLRHEIDMQTFVDYYFNHAANCQNMID